MTCEGTGNAANRRMLSSMNLKQLRRVTRARLQRQSGAFDLPSIMIGVAVVAILTVGVLAAIFGVIPWSEDKAAQQDLAAVHDAESVAFAKDGGFRDKSGLVGAKLLSSDVNAVDSLEVRSDSEGRKYVGVSTSETGRKFIITSEAPTPRLLTNVDTWPNGDLIDGTAPSPSEDETPPENPAAVATYSCGPTELVITQAMLDHSEKNQAMLDAGRAEDMVPFPGGGWNVIVDLSKVDPSLHGVLLSPDGAINPVGTTNSAGPSAIYGAGGTCNMYGVVDGELHADQGPAMVEAVNDVVIAASYYTHGELDRADGAAMLRYNTDGSPDKEQWWVRGDEHRSNGPAATEFASETQYYKQEYWTKGKLNRADGPAVISWDSNGQLSSEDWYSNGSRHRVGGPATISYASEYKAREDQWYRSGEHYRTTSYYFGTDSKSQDEWFKGTDRHRTDGPAIVHYNEDGTVSVEEYLQYNQYNREGAPASIFYTPSGSRSSERWYLDGELHRVGGPAQIGYLDDGSVYSEQWFTHGQLHRLDGPADYVFDESGNYMTGQERWFINAQAIHSKDALVQAGGDPTNWPEHWG